MIANLALVGRGHHSARPAALAGARPCVTSEVSARCRRGRAPHGRNV